ncbi:DUF4386 domain-containing protein [Aquimarina sp. 2201CG5-10]|uniref:DUF4386 domain-containing protein n=1 Tax=Aquimarina callyspongiae TaxID=3098150 RepID=UPI002AB4DE39|nr:DUF4386 domain-containing protein [Aquimarina sp. 2201CG5-10]MDY8138042.1 DUF4386 domain-containing protein [Aquimarina sp. 2201CG5-10]
MYSNKKMGRLAGALFLILVIAGVFAEFFVRQKLFVSNDLAATTQNIIDNEWLFRLGFVSDLLMSTTFFFYTYVLYLIFKSVSKNISLFMLLCVVISVAMYCQNMLNQYSALMLLTDPSYSEAFRNDQLQVLSTFFLNIHTEGYFVNQIFYGMYLLPLGYMIYKSRLVPRIIGVLLMLGCIVDLINFGVYFLFPNTESVFLQNITIPADIAEISFCLWLLIMGVRNQPPN